MSKKLATKSPKKEKHKKYECQISEHQKRNIFDFRIVAERTYILLGCFVFNLFVPPTNPFSPPLFYFLIFFFLFTEKKKNTKIQSILFHSIRSHYTMLRGIKNKYKKKVHQRL